MNNSLPASTFPQTRANEISPQPTNVQLLINEMREIAQLVSAVGPINVNTDPQTRELLNSTRRLVGEIVNILLDMRDDKRLDREE